MHCNTYTYTIYTIIHTCIYTHVNAQLNIHTHTEPHIFICTSVYIFLCKYLNVIITIITTDESTLAFPLHLELRYIYKISACVKLVSNNSSSN